MGRYLRQQEDGKSIDSWLQLLLLMDACMCKAASDAVSSHPSTQQAAQHWLHLRSRLEHRLVIHQDLACGGGEEQDAEGVCYLLFGSVGASWP